MQNIMRGVCIIKEKKIQKTSKMCLDDEFAQFALVTVVFVDHSLFIVNTIEYATHNAIWNTLQFSKSKHFWAIFWKNLILGTQRAQHA